MELQIAEALKRVGETFSFSLTETLPAQEYGQRRIEFCEPVRVSGSYVFDGAGIALMANAETAICAVCARCGTACVEPLDFPVNERFSKAADPENDEMYPYAGDRLELTRAVLDNLYLHLPIATVCGADCKGLCPVCGADRNRVKCNCQTKQRANAFAALAGLTDEE